MNVPIRLPCSGIKKYSEAFDQIYYCCKVGDVSESTFK